MKPISIFILILFFAALAADCYCIIEGYANYRFITKPLLMILLIVVFINETKHTRHKATKNYVIGALVSSLVGDVLMLFDHLHIYFVIGIAVFLITHILYTIIFCRMQPFAKEKGFLIFIWGAFVLIYVIVITCIIWQGVDKNDLEAPVLLYIMAIGLMLLCAINTSIGSIRKVAYSYFIPGALLFIGSDSLLAINRFSSPIKYAPLIIMISYAAAQFLITNGCIKVLKKQKSRSKRRSGSV